MNRRWSSVKIDSLRAVTPYSLVGGPFGSNLTTRDYVEDGVPVIRGSNLPDEREFEEDGFVFVSDDKANALTSNLAYPGDVVFTQRGTLGQVGIIPETARFQRYVISQSQMKLTVNEDLARSRFVYYFFRHPNTVQEIKNRSITSGVPHINLGILKDFNVPLPPIYVQDEIVKVLSAYDNLIENNRRRMALLEESARLLNREWFVRLRFPGYEHTPIVDGVPQGWERKTLGDSITLNYGKALKAEIRIEGDYPVYGSSGIVGTHEKPLVQGPAIILGRKGNVGSVYWSSKSFYPIDTVYFVSPESSSLYLFYTLKNMHFISTDVAVPGLNRDFAYSRPLLHPPTTLLRSFHETVEPIHAQLDKLEEVNQKLRATRDLLLPRLMSGELAV
jgi:type I restriction enzyme S subunit